MSHLIILLIRFYQHTHPLRAQLYLTIGLTPHACRHHPTCSQYAINSLHRYGTIHGLYLSLKRLLTCHSFSPSS